MSDDLPAELGEIEVRGGKAVIAKDFFFGKTSLSLLPPAWWPLTVKYFPYLARGKVADNLALGLPTAANIAAWKIFLTTEVFGKSFTNHMKHGYNNGLSQTSSDGMTYSGEWPRSQGDAKKLLFADSMTNMVKGGEYGIPMSCLWMWVYYLSSEGCVSKWVENAVEDYIVKSGYHIILGDKQESKSISTTHCFYRVGRKAGTNSFQTVVRRYQKLHWGVDLKANSLIGDSAPPNERFQIIDLGNLLHQDVKSQMHRKDSTRFKIAFQDHKIPDAQTLLDGRVSELVFWAEDNGFYKKDVVEALRRRVDAESNNDGDGTMARPAVAKIVGELKSPPETLGNAIPRQKQKKGTTMAPPRRTKTTTTKPTSKGNTKGNKLSSSKRKKDKRVTGLETTTKNMLDDFMNQVSTVFVIQILLKSIAYSTGCLRLI